MPHMVIFRNSEGKPGYHQADTLEEAVRFAERLRNKEGVTDSRIFRMQEVPIEFKTVYRVEIVGGSLPEPVSNAPVKAEAPAALAGDAGGEPVAAASARFGLFSKS